LKQNEKLVELGLEDKLYLKIYMLRALGVVCAFTLLAVLMFAAQAATTTTKFKPGAEVTLQYYFTVPAGFHIGDDPAAGIIFDKEKLKKLPVTVTKFECTWPRTSLGVKTSGTGGEKTTVAAKVKLKLKSNCPVGELSVPVTFEVFYCNVKEGWCTSSQFTSPIKLTISKKSGSVSKGSKKITFNADPNA
jgi:hypothetical protein